jgi:chromosome segregation ATPase
MLGHLRTIAIAGAVAVAFAAPAFAQATPDSENGRYTFSPTADGVLRLDTRTGSLASCHNRIAGWSCYAVPDERAALDAEIGKLTRENTQLKDTLARFKDEQGRFDRDIATLKEAHLRLDAERMKLKEDLDKREAATHAPKIDAEIGKLQRENTQLKDNLARFKDEQVRFDRDIAALKEAHLRLDAERMKLKDELDKREAAAPAPKIDAPLSKEDSQKKGVAREAGRSDRLELQLPDDREVEKVISFVERAWKRLIEMANRVQRDVSGKI